MYFNAENLNKLGLFQKFGGWLEEIYSRINKLENKSKDSPELKYYLNYIEDIHWFLFLAHTALKCLTNMEHYAKHCCLHYKMQEPSLVNNTNQISYWSLENLSNFYYLTVVNTKKNHKPFKKRQFT
ncbi:MAG: hypothetical protein ACTSUE_25395 [Promethearchaeota archaeon]